MRTYFRLGSLLLPLFALLLAALAGLGAPATAARPGGGPAARLPAPGCPQLWTQVPSVDPGPYYNQLRGVSAVAANDVWAVGYDGDVGSSSNHTLAEHWNGSAWTVSPGTAPAYSYFNGV